MIGKATMTAVTRRNFTSNKYCDGDDQHNTNKDNDDISDDGGCDDRTAVSYGLFIFMVSSSCCVLSYSHFRVDQA